MAPPPPSQEVVKEVRTVAELQKLISADARKGNIRRKIRCVGTGSSYPETVVPTRHQYRYSSADLEFVVVRLQGDLAKVQQGELDSETGETQFLVGAGCIISSNPSSLAVKKLDPTSGAESIPLLSEGKKDDRVATDLKTVVDAAGCMIPNLPQSCSTTVGGYLSTTGGIASGLLSPSFASCIDAIELVDGRGELKLLKKGTREFSAAGLSLGLFGIIVRIRFTFPAKLKFHGTLDNMPFDDSPLQSKEEFLHVHRLSEYVHCQWVPAKDVDVVQTFRARRIQPSAHTGRSVLHYHTLTSTGLAVFYAVVMSFICLCNWIGLQPVASYLLAIMYKPEPATSFLDQWYRLLGKEDVTPSFIRRGFPSTEFYFDLEQYDLVLSTCCSIFKRDAVAAGNCQIELFIAQQNPFWLSPCYNKEQLVLSISWWKYDFAMRGTIEENFRNRFWDHLMKIPSAKPRWGKLILSHPVDNHFSTMMVQWRELRTQFDPHDVFLTEYWGSVLGIRTSAVDAGGTKAINSRDKLAKKIS